MNQISPRERYKCGKPKKGKPQKGTGNSTIDQQIKHAQDIENVEKQTVLAQPHRRGNLSQLCGDAFGRFVLATQCGEDCYTAGNQYRELVNLWRWRNNIPGARRPDGDAFGFGEITKAVMDRLKQHIDDCDKEMDNAAWTILGWQKIVGGNMARGLILDDKEPHWSFARIVVKALQALAAHLRLIRL
jgi:hypothetical protein